MQGRTNWTSERRARFLETLALGYSVVKAAAAAGWSRSSAFSYRDQHEDFRAEWEAAVEAGTDLMEDEMRRRAFEGVDEPVFYQGEACGSVRKYSDTLMIFQMKKRRPEYRDSVDVKHSGTVGLTGLLRSLDGEEE